jgi:hypothetical protein
MNNAVCFFLRCLCSWIPNQVGDDVFGIGDDVVGSGMTCLESGIERLRRIFFSSLLNQSVRASSLSKGISDAYFALRRAQGERDGVRLAITATASEIAREYLTLVALNVDRKAVRYQTARV